MVQCEIYVSVCNGLRHCKLTNRLVTPGKMPLLVACFFVLLNTAVNSAGRGKKGNRYAAVSSAEIRKRGAMNPL